MPDSRNSDLKSYLRKFTSPTISKRSTKLVIGSFGGEKVPMFINEFWTAEQRKASSIHEISYRACFKPQLPKFFIDLFTKNGDIVYDPFSGRGTTAIEAGLCGCKVIANDSNPLSKLMTEPRFTPPTISAVEKRLNDISRDGPPSELDLSMFYHPKTEREIVAIRNYIAKKRQKGEVDYLDRWIAMVATNRLTGHSSGFLSVYTLPPNQAVSQQSQMRINMRRNQVPEYRDTHNLIIRKTKSLIRTLTASQVRQLKRASKQAQFLTTDSRYTPEIVTESVQLTVTSPPFLDIVQYQDDNWLRCWFNNLDSNAISKRITMAKSVEEWTRVIRDVFYEIYRLTKKGGWLAFEVGEVRKGTVRLEEEVVPLGLDAGFTCEAIMINSQEFTKTSHIWGVDNMGCGTNTNRIVIFRKEK
ncbi:MAG: DNA methyltransferase [Methanoregulaceae archaeon]